MDIAEGEKANEAAVTGFHAVTQKSKLIADWWEVYPQKIRLRTLLSVFEDGRRASVGVFLLWWQLI